MKILKIVLVSTLVLLFFVGCQQSEPEAPVLVAPEDGAVFDSLPPTFVWSGQVGQEYYLMILKDSLWSSHALVSNGVTDTSYSLSMDDFLSADIGVYEWTVGVMDSLTDTLIYPSPRKFHIREFVFPLDLDTTFFPFGMGYEWRYETHDWINSLYDTTSVKVIDSFWDSDTFLFKLEGSLFFLGDIVKIRRNRVELIDWGPVPVIPDEDSIERTYSYADTSFTYGRTITYIGDSLKIHSYFRKYFGWTEGLKGTRDTTSILIRGIGAVHQKGDLYIYGDDWEDMSYTLLWFYNGKDTVYKAP